MKRFLVVLGLLLAACGTAPQSHGGPVQDQVSFVDTLRGEGLTVDPTGTVAQPFLQPQSGTVLRISGAAVATPADLQAFEYSSAAAAGADARRLRPDGSGTANTNRRLGGGATHFFLKGRILILYVGSDPAVVGILKNVLGSQVAGG